MKRIYSSEIMDDFSIGGEMVDAALKELKIINIFLGGNAVTRAGLKKIIARFHVLNKVNVLDVGAGAADILISLKKDFTGLKITGLDKNRRAGLYLKNNSDTAQVVTGDALSLPFKKKFDVIHISLFLHHFRDEEIVLMIKEFRRLTNYGIIINDLRRSVPAYLGIKILTKLFSRSAMVKNDAPLSVRRGFLKKDLLKILRSAGSVNFVIKRKWAFRWLVVVFN